MFWFYSFFKTLDQNQRNETIDLMEFCIGFSDNAKRETKIEFDGPIGDRRGRYSTNPISKEI